MTSAQYVPPHVNIFYCPRHHPGLFSDSVRAGFAMTFYYKPTVAEAIPGSALMTDVSFGWLIRSVHRWAPP